MAMIPYLNRDHFTFAATALDCGAFAWHVAVDHDNLQLTSNQIYIHTRHNTHKNTYMLRM